MEEINRHVSFGGQQLVLEHGSKSCSCDMTFALYLPPATNTQKVPILWYLSGLTCTHENVMNKGHFQYYASREGLALVFPDSSPRGEAVADDEAYDLGQGAGFYLNATQKPWAPHFQMESYLIEELPRLLEQRFPQLDFNRQGITGHSMGGHGAFNLALKYPDRFTSLSAFAPISNPTASDWGRKQFSAYLGENQDLWVQHDASLLLRERGWNGEILVDQGCEDNFWDLLRPEALAKAVTECRQPARLRYQKGYDHSYFFVASFAGDHVAFHAERLKD